jgi:hypothetical protein
VYKAEGPGGGSPAAAPRISAPGAARVEDFGRLPDLDTSNGSPEAANASDPRVGLPAPCKLQGWA